MQEIKKYDFIDALRGLAVLAVLFVHTELWMPPPRYLENVARDGARGVQLFFVVSAFTLFLSMRSRKKAEANPTRNFFIRRFFRIAPLYYVSVIFWLLLDGFGPRFWSPNGINLWHILSTLTFTNGWHPEYNNAIVPVGWTVAVEMNFYLLVPFLFALITTLPRAILFTLGSLFVGSLLSFAGDRWLLPTYSENAKFIASGFFDVLWLPAEMAVFGCGFILYFLFRQYHDRLISKGKRTINLITLGSVCAMVLVAPIHSPAVIYVYAILFVIFALCLSAYPMPLFVNRPLCYIGKISYSVYLIHIALLHLFHWPVSNVSGIAQLTNFGAAFTVLIAASVLVSSLTYRLIEMPGQSLGKALIAHLESADLRKQEAEESDRKGLITKN